MTVKDFKVGAKAYVIASVRCGDFSIREVEIEKVGRKFVYAKGGYYGFYLRDEDENYLVEEKEWGAPDVLFLTRQDAEEKIERDTLLKLIRKETEYAKLSSLSLDQLRRINQILHE